VNYTFDIIGNKNDRSIKNQAGHRSKIGKCAGENPDLTDDLIKKIFAGIEELKQGNCTEYQFR
jgi:hypothetical protein